MNQADQKQIHLHSKSYEQTMDIGHALGEMLKAGDVVALVGMLGAGKTQLVRGLARGLGMDTRLVSSPTYVLMCEYPPAKADDIPLVHIDAYRLESLDDLESIGWCEELLADSITVIEWADRLGDELPSNLLRIELQHEEDETRSLTVSSQGDFDERFDAIASQLAASILPEQVCPTCKERGRFTEETFPFCSTRCKMADLSQWFGESYKISRGIEEADLHDGE